MLACPETLDLNSALCQILLAVGAQNCLGFSLLLLLPSFLILCPLQLAPCFIQQILCAQWWLLQPPALEGF